MPPRRDGGLVIAAADSDSDISLPDDDYDDTREKGKGKAKAKAKRSDKGKGKAKDSVRSGTISYQHQLKSALASIHLGGILYAFMGHSTRGRGWKFAGVRRRVDG